MISLCLKKYGIISVVFMISGTLYFTVGLSIVISAEDARRMPSKAVNKMRVQQQLKRCTIRYWILNGPYQRVIPCCLKLRACIIVITRQLKKHLPAIV